jgi:signal transduction histidine kinase
MLLLLPWLWLLLVFPDGRLRGRLDRLAARGLAVVVVGVNLVTGFVPGDMIEPFPHAKHTLGTWETANYLAPVFLVGFLAFLLISVSSPIRRARKANEFVRVQVRWLTLAGLTVPGALLLCWIGYAIGHPNTVIVGLLAMFLAIPAGTAIAILRTDLYDVDRALVSGTAYAVLAFFVVALAAVISSLAGLVAGNGSMLLAAGATAVTLLALNPLRHRIEQVLSKRLYPIRERAIEAAAALRHRVSSGEARPEELEGVLRVAMRDPNLRLGYVVPGTEKLVDAEGAMVEPTPQTTPVLLAGQTIGILVPGPGSLRPPPREIATEITMLVEMVRLRMELAVALQDVEASRARLLRASYDERRRLERDLHDGAQQRLVSLGMSLRIAQRHLPAGSAELSGLIDEAVAEISTAVAELRKIAHGLRPSNLDDGLPAALANLTSKSPMPIDLDLDAGELPDAVCTTAYFVASEAVTNAVKYAAANRIALRVSQDEAAVHVEISDDGQGGASIRPGGGLAGLVDRVHALGGVLHVVSPHGGGTLVEAVLPCAS